MQTILTEDLANINYEVRHYFQKRLLKIRLDNRLTMPLCTPVFILFYNIKTGDCKHTKVKKIVDLNTNSL